MKKSHFLKISLRLTSLLLALLVSGCSSFNRDWRHAPVAVQNSVEGRWEGQWTSEANHHHGQLRCLMSRETGTNSSTAAIGSVAPDANSVTLYKARFHATFLRWLHFNYTAQLEFQPHDIGWEFNGEADLGKFAGGLYYYEGRASATNLVSLYRAKHDHGHFELKRPN